jgi:hypothetical protein
VIESGQIYKQATRCLTCSTGHWQQNITFCFSSFSVSIHYSKECNTVVTQRAVSVLAEKCGNIVLEHSVVGRIEAVFTVYPFVLSLNPDISELCKSFLSELFYTKIINPTLN